MNSSAFRALAAAVLVFDRDEYFTTSPPPPPDEFLPLPPDAAYHGYRIKWDQPTTYRGGGNEIGVRYVLMLPGTNDQTLLWIGRVASAGPEGCRRALSEALNKLAEQPQSQTIDVDAHPHG